MTICVDRTKFEQAVKSCLLFQEAFLISEAQLFTCVSQGVRSVWERGAIEVRDIRG